MGEKGEGGEVPEGKNFLIKVSAEKLRKGGRFQQEGIVGSPKYGSAKFVGADGRRRDALGSMGKARIHNVKPKMPRATQNFEAS